MNTLLRTVTVFLLILLVLLLACQNKQSDSETYGGNQNWTHYVRTAGHGLSKDRVADIMKSATETHVFGIETDNDIPGRYESFLDPTEKLEALRAMADAAHAAGNYAYVYIAGLECITANADKTEHTFFKDHPDWVQRKISGEPAIFGGGTAFWIDEGDEDVWISPYAPEWKKIYMERVRQIAGTGIDGVYVDIPYWMTHFDGWEDSWASFDDYTVAAFKTETGLNAKTDFKLGDFSDPNFRKWIDFRIKTLTAFMREIDKNVKSVNQKCMTIAEIYPGYGEEAVRVGADVYDMYPVVDVIAHEYSSGGNAARRNPFEWFTYMTGMYSFRDFAEGKASWMLSYSWDERQKVDPKEAIKNLALSQVMAGTNFWDARGHVMSGSNDYPTRTLVNKWIAEHEKIIYLPRERINPLGVYFSAKTRDYFADDFYQAYTGMMHLLMQTHQEFQVVTPRTLANFKGEVLILPDVKCVSDEEVAQLTGLLTSGKKLLATAESGKCDLSGNDRSLNPVHQLLGVSDPANPIIAVGTSIYLPGNPGKDYYQLARKVFNESAWSGIVDESLLAAQNDFLKLLNENLQYKPVVQITASPFISTQIARVNNKIHIFLANFKGLKGRENPVQLPEENIQLVLPGMAESKVFMLDYLGATQTITTQFQDAKVSCTLPPVQKGAIVWIE
jgi:hypothetical protein